MTFMASLCLLHECQLCRPRLYNSERAQLVFMETILLHRISRSQACSPVDDAGSCPPGTHESNIKYEGQ